MSTQDKKIKVVSTADFDNNKIINATIDASENEVIGVGKIDDVLVNGESVVENKIANVEVPTKVSDLENDSGYTTTADVNSEIIANSSFMDNELKEGSFNAVMNDAITKGIEKNKVSVVDSFVDTLPSETLTLGQSVLNKTDNKIYKVVGEKQIEDYYFKINGSLSINNDDGCITGFSEENYISFADDVIEYTNPVWSNIKVNKLIFTLAPAYTSYTTTIFSIIRRDDNSVLFGVDYTSGYGGRLDIYTKKRDGTKVDSYTIYAAVTNSRYELEITNSCYVKILDRGKTIAIKYFGSLEPSTEVGDDFYYNIPADIKISSKKITSQQYTYTVGIQKLYGLESNITYQSGGMPSGGDIVYFSDNGVWNNGTELFSGKLVYNTANYGLYEYNGTNMVPLIPDMKLYQKKLAAGNNITLSPEGYQNFSNSNYLSFNSTVDSTYSDDFFFKVTINETNRLNTLLYSSFDTDKYGYIEITDENKLSCGWSSGSSIITFIGANYVFQPNKTYWIRLVQNRVPQQFYILEDNNYTIETVPKDRSVWTADARNPSYSFIVKLYANSTNYLGYRPSAPEYYFKGAIAEFSVGNIFTLSTATEGVDFTNHGCLKGPVISATVPEIEIDSQLSDVSENPVQNKVITNALNDVKVIPLTDSGNTLPNAMDYQEEDTFLKTTNKKIYSIITIPEYAFAADVNNQNNYVVLDSATGIATHFGQTPSYSPALLSKPFPNELMAWTGDRDYYVQFKLSQLNSGIFKISSSTNGSDTRALDLSVSQQGEVNLIKYFQSYGNTSQINVYKLLDTTINTDTVYKIVLEKRSDSLTTYLYNANAELIESKTISVIAEWVTTTPSNTVTFVYGYAYYATTEGSYPTTLYLNGELDLVNSIGDFVTEKKGWDSGTDIVSNQFYIDYTNKLNYINVNNNLISSLSRITDDYTSTDTTTYPSSYALHEGLNSVKDIPIKVTNSGSTLPSTQGLNLNDNFLNTSDNKLYGLKPNSYQLNTNVYNGVTVDFTTGIASGFRYEESPLSIYGIVKRSAVVWKGSNKVYKIHFKINELSADDVQSLYGESLGDSSTYTSYIMRFEIKNKRLYLYMYTSHTGTYTELQNTQIFDYELTTNTEYYFQITKNGEMAEASLSLTNYNTNVVAENIIETQDIIADNISYSCNMGYNFNSGSTTGYIYGESVYPDAKVLKGQIYLLDSTGDFLKPNMSDLIWDSGTPLTNSTRYADITNKIIYLYFNNQLFSTVTPFAQITGQPTDNANLATALNSKQDTLVSGTNIKTINDNSIVGSGNVTIKTYLPFNSNWTVNSTTEQLCDDINDDTSAVAGNAYLGILRTSDLPNNMIQADAVVEIIGESGGSKVIHITITSADRYPYRWEYSYFNDQSVYGWIGFQPELPDQSGNNGKFLTTNGYSMSWATVQGGGGTSDYSDLSNKPSINSTTLSGNKTSSDLGLQSTLTWTYTEATETLEVE